MSPLSKVDSDEAGCKRSIVDDLCGVGLPVDEDRHFPKDDFIDRLTGAQYFLHRHLSAEVGDTTHIHIFKRWSSEQTRAVGLDSTITHLAALALDAKGQPDHWFVVNQWVVGDYWLSADETVDLFRGWAFSKGSNLKNPRYRYWHEWLANLVAANLDQTIHGLLRQRDQILDRMVDANPGVNVLEDRSIEVICHSGGWERGRTLHA